MQRGVWRECRGMYGRLCGEVQRGVHGTACRGHGEVCRGMQGGIYGDVCRVALTKMPLECGTGMPWRVAEGIIPVTSPA